MLFFTQKIKGFFANSFVRLVFLILIITIAAGYSGNRFIFVNAFNNQVNIVPGKFMLEGGDNEHGWKNIDNAFSQDLSNSNDISYFNASNSAYIIINKTTDGALPEILPNSNSGDNPPAPDDIGNSNDITPPPENNVPDGEANKAAEESPKDSVPEPTDMQNEIAPEPVNAPENEEDNLNEKPSASAINTESDNKKSVGEFPSDDSAGSEVNTGPVLPETDNSLVPETTQEPLEEAVPSDASGSVNEEGDTSFIDKILNNVQSLLSYFKAVKFIMPDSAKAEDAAVIETGGKTDTTAADAAKPFSSAIIFSDFFVPLEYQENGIGNINLRISLAALSEKMTGEISVDYSIGEEWNNLGVFKAFSKLSNSLNGDYFQFPLPEEINWEDIKNLKIRINYQNPDISKEKNLQIYLDALWLEADYNNVLTADDQNQTEENKVPKEKENEYEIKLISEKKVFEVGELPNFKFRFKKNQGLIGSLGSKLISLFYDEYKDIAISANVENPDDPTETDKLNIEYLDDGEFKISFLDKPRQFKPGRQSLKILVNEQGQEYNLTQDFVWGVLALNINKSVYLSPWAGSPQSGGQAGRREETAYLQMGVLDDSGHTICDADLTLEITAPDGGIAYLSTDNGLISRNPECNSHPNNVIDDPDYFAYYGIGGTGKYLIKLIAQTKNGQREISDKFEVRDELPFEIERIGPTRIYPPAFYKMAFRVKAKQNFSGEFIEKVPISFDISKNKGIFTRESGDAKELSWTVNWQAGKVYDFFYVFKAPDISPEFYLLGPAEVKPLRSASANHSGLASFTEERQWQIAADSIATAITSEAMAAKYNDTGNMMEAVAASSTEFIGGHKYLIYVSSGFSHTSATAYVDYEIRFGSTVMFSGRYEPVSSLSDIREAAQLSWFDVYDQPTTPEDISLYFQATGGYALNAQIIALDLSALETSDWKYASNTTQQAHSAAPTWDNKASITLDNADGAKDWLVMATEEVQVDSATVNMQGRIYDGSSSYMQYSREGEDNSEQVAYVIMRPFDDVAQNTQFTLQVNDDATGINDHLKSRIFALNLDAFASHKTYYADINTSLATRPSWTEIANLNSGGNYAPQADGDQLIFASWIDDVGANNAEMDDRLQVGGTTYPTGWSWYQTGTITGKESYDTTDEIFNTIVAKVNMTSSGAAINLSANGETTGRVADEAALAVFSLKLPFIVLANEQYHSDGATAIPNGGWATSTVKLSAIASSISASSSQINYYFEALDNSGTFTTATSEPASYCANGTTWGSCSSKIWQATTSIDWLTGWSYRKKITINAAQIPANQTDFPVLATTTDADLADTANGGHVASSTGADIVVTDSDGTTKLNYEREYYDNTTGQAVLWIRADISSTTNKDLYIYYGNSNITEDQATTTGVWDDDYLAVWHMNDNTTTQIVDSTKNGYTGTKGAANQPLETSGQIGYAQYFDGSDYIDFGDVLDPGSNDWTVEVWYDPTAAGSLNGSILYNKENLWEASAGGGYNTYAWQPHWAWDGGTSFPISTNNWYYGIVTYDHNYQRLYKNGTEVYNRGQTGDIGSNSTRLQIGARGDTGHSSFFTGNIDEIRVSKIARSATWLKTEYNNQHNISGFLSFGSEEEPSQSFPSIAVINGLPGSSNGYKWQVLGCENGGGCSAWDNFNDTTPNFKVDATAPQAPGPLTLNSKTSTQITLNFGYQAVDANFSDYKIFYKKGSSGVSVSDTEHDDADLDYIDYNGTSNTTVSGLEPGTTYVFNIWAYDAAGNKTPAGSELTASTNQAGRANTVEFIAGAYSGDGTTGQLSDTDYNFDSFNFRLGEEDVSIANAYIVFEAQFEAYANNAGAYTGYNLAFDSCQEPCTADAWNGTSRILKDDNTVLAYDETESNQVRLFLDVTDEAQLAAYTGNSVNLAGQVGYRIERGAATTSIASARAKLVITYTYDRDSQTFTNTVVYPLSSSASGDSGSRQSVQADDCVLDSNCPLFSYDMEIPEYSSSPGAARLSQWFTAYNINDLNNANDILVDVNIESNGATSSTYVHEAANSGTQGEMPGVYFFDVPGFSENTNQSLEYHAYCPASGANYYLVGGEAQETYLASSTAGTKTRTVSFPIGVINNGDTTNQTLGSTQVYFPENGGGSGNIIIKKAWLRIISNSYTTPSDATISVNTKTGANATSSAYTYTYNVGGSVIKPSFTIIHIIPAGDYAELALANANNPKTVILSTTNSDGANQGGLSAELMITYTYTSETYGYLTNLRLMAGQSETNGNSQLATATIAKAIFPEPAGTKTVLAAGLRANYLVSDSDSGVANANLSLDANLATASPACSNAYISHPDSTNSFTEFYKNVVTNLTTINNQSYAVCFSNDGAGDTSGGAKMGGELSYVYKYDNPATIFVDADNQYKADNFTAIANGAWTDENEVNLKALSTYSGSSTKINFYFEALDNSGSFTTDNTEPTSACTSGTAFGSCSSKIWTDFASTSLDWLTGWSYRKKITINAAQIPANQTDFPVLATTTDADLADTANGGHVASSTGADIVVTDSDGTTKLNYEREYYDNTTGQAVLWIRADISSTTNKDLYIYYGNSNITEDQATTTGVWDDNYMAVWHMNDNTTTQIVDSTKNGYTGTKGAANQPLETTGQIGYAQYFDGSDYIDFGDVLDPGSNDWTVEVWYDPTAAGSLNGSILYNKENLWEASAGGGYNTYAWQPHWAWDGGTSFPISTNNWYYGIVTYDHNYQRLYKNGTEVYNRGQTGDIGSNSTRLQIGARGDTGHSSFFTGNIDEIRVSKIARSATWLKTEYNNQHNISGFLSFGSEDSVSSINYEGRVNIVSIPDSAAGYKWQVLACEDGGGSCTDWQTFGTPPNFKVDATPPAAPGNLTLATTTPTSITLNFGAASSDANFTAYKIFYKEGLSEVSESDTEHSDSNLAYIDYNGAATTTISGLQSYTQYVINIWAYDAAGNKTSATEIQVTTAQAAAAKANTVEFFAGSYSGDGTTGQLSDTDYTFSDFNFRLGESEAEIRNAYIIFEAQFEAYANNSGAYTGYNLAFDACQEPCTADAWNGTGRILKDDNTVLAYDETESNQVRLLLDVTDEAQLAAYSGGGNLEGQVGYRIERGTAVNSIASARAKLVITYSYDADNSINFTKTVIYPLESTVSGDSGSRRASQAANCTKNSNCPLFSYNVTAPEAGQSLSQWYETYFVNDSNNANDINFNVNIQGSDVDSDTYIHESALAGTQGNIGGIIFNNVYGFSANTTQSLEMYTSAGTAYLMGGEIKDTYVASSSASTQTRTVSFPIGIISNGQSLSTASGTVQVYFPENGSGSGVVDIKKAWLRIVGNDYNSGADTITISSKIGDNSQSGNYIYNLDVGGTVVKPEFMIIHVIPSSDYSELEAANAASSKAVTAFVAADSLSLGGLSAELMITYTYTSESAGYLTSLNLFGGQSDQNSNAQNVTAIASPAVFPETRGVTTVRAGALLASDLITDSDAAVPGAWFSLDANIGTTSPTCSPAYYARPDSTNGFFDFYRDISANILTTDRQAYYVCLANSNGSDQTAGAKMNAIWHYTYQWDAPQPEFTQSDWRWYENADSVQPTIPKAAENTAISGINLADITRLRMSVGISKEDMSAHTQTFKLQYGKGTDCSSVSAWSDVGGLSGSADWIGYNNPAPVDGDSLSAVLLASSTVAESYEESNSSVSNPATVVIGEYGEWDWALYNNNASSSAQYCFRMVKSDGSAFEDYLSDSYPIIMTAASNTPPDNSIDLGQYLNDELTVIPNGGWISTSSVKLTAAAIDPNINQTITLYFELKPNSGSFTTATSEPSGACVYGTAYGSCSSKIWFAASSSPGDWRTNPYTGTTSITAIPESSAGYKWQVLACDNFGACANAWIKPGTSPNFRVDTTAPSPPGNLSYATSTAVSITLNFSASSTEDNFSTYRIFYKLGTSGVTEADLEHSDDNLNYQDYNGATSTIVNNLTANSTYVFNIFAYDLAGNKAAAAVEAIGTTSSSFTPPIGQLSSASEKTDGSGVIDVTILVDDPDNNDTLRAKIMYYNKGTSSCDSYAAFSDPTLDEADASTYATYGDPDVDNDSVYQVGTTSAWILTSPGQNYVFFDWLSYLDEPAADGDYCLGLVVNDGMFDQVATHTLAVTLDNVNPDKPGYLTLGSKNYTSATLNFGTSSADTNFKEYKIFYKEGTAGVSESDNVWDKTDDVNLDAVDFNNAATTTISGLSPNTDYVFNIWAYDDYGNKASATKELTIKTNAKPANISADNQYHSDGTTVISNGAWTDEDMVIFKASAHDQDTNDLVTFYYQLITATGTYASATEVPQNTCAYGTDFGSCSSNIWAVSTTTSELPSDWYDSNWLYRKKITINASQVESNLSGFPVLATSTDSDLAAYARTDGYDIIFTDSSGTTTLPYEREYYDSISGKLAVWIKADVSSSTDTDLYMYYGNAQANTDPATTTGVWDSAYRGVWHLPESVVDESSQTGAHLDSTVNSNNGDQHGNNEMPGRIYRGQEFDGNDYIGVNNNSSLNMANELTLSAWLKVNGNSEWKYKRDITLSIATPVADYETMVQLNNSSFDYSKTKSGGADIRFYDSADTELSYWIEEWNISGTSTIWVKIPVSGTSNITMYYGNPSAAAASNGTSTFEFFDDFSGTSLASKWQADANDYSVSGGVLRINIGAVGLVNPLSFYMNDNYIVESRMYFYSNTGGYSGTLSGQSSRYTQSGNAGSDATSLYMRTSGSTDVYRWTGSGSAASYNCGSGSVWASANTTWYILGAGFDSTGVDLWRDRSSSWSYGCGWTKNIDYLSLGSFNGSASTDIQDTGYDWILVRKYTASEPVAAVGDEEGAGIYKADAYGINLDSATAAGTVNNTTATATIASGWNFIALTYDRNAPSGQLKFYVNGNLASSQNLSAAVNINSNNFIFGGLLDGLIDEVRLASTSRSASWVKTEYNNQHSINNFLSFSSQEPVTSYFESMLVINIPNNPSYATGYKWQVMACDDDGDCSTWDAFNPSVPNFKIDTIAPSSPGALTLNSKTSNSITLNFGAQTSEDNFSRYRIFYSTSTPVSESDTELSDSNLNYIDYNGASITTVNGLVADTTYYFNIWAYDEVGNKASSSITAIKTSAPVSSPGAVFYTKGTRVLYYKVWDGASWGSEQTGPTLGSAAGDNIRHVRVLRSDDGGKIAVLAKTWDGTNQEWWATVYRFAADDFINTAQLGAAEGDANHNDLISGCLASLSGNEFFIVRNNNAADGTLVYSWNATDGWTAEGAGPNPVAVVNGCRLARRPGTDNYLLMTFDDDRDVGSAYYYGGSTYANTWTTWTQHSATEENTSNYVGEAFFDPSDNTRGAMNFSNSATAWNTQAKFFIAGNSTVNYGAASTSPSVWTDDFVHGEFAADPGGTGIAYYAGDDIDYRLNVLKLDISSSQPAWSTVTSGTDITGTRLYQYTNNSQKPYAIGFYKSHYGVVAWSDRTNQMVYYRKINAGNNSLDSASTAVPGADSNIWTRVRFYKDPNEQEFLALYQNDDIDYSAVFWDGASNAFYSSGNQAWTELVTNSGAFSANDEDVAFAYAAYNSPPNQPTNLVQQKEDATTTIANQGWTNESGVHFKADINDPDTSENLKVYLNLIANSDTFDASTTEPTNTCATSTAFGSCNSKIWQIASSTGDFSVTSLIASATISGLPDSSLGYKWQIKACDDDAACSAWAVYSASGPNFKVDTIAPTAPGPLTVSSLTSQTVTLAFGATSTEDNFYTYKIFYSSSTPVTESDVEHSDSDLNDILFNGTSNTIVNGLASNTLYYFNIYAYDLAGNKASATPEISTTTALGPNLAQTSYLWENDDGGDVNSNSGAAAIDTALSGVYIGERINVRMQIENNGGDIASGKVYKLQFENQTDDPGTWVDVGASTEISYSLGLSGANNDSITSSKTAANSNAWVNGAWQENTGQTASFSLTNGYYTEFVFALKTDSALTNKTYRLRLYNSSDSEALNSYNSYPTLSTAASETIKYSKNALSSLPSATGDLTYYLDPLGYSDISADNSNRDEIISASNYPVYLFAVKHTNNTDAMAISWNGQSTASSSVNNIVLQAYTYGSPNQWTTITTHSTSSADTDFSLSAYINSSLSEYYDGSYWTYWRIYQESGSQTLKTDYFNISFSAPTPDVSQAHYRWRNDDGSQTAATWRESQDNGDPTAPTTAINKGDNIRLRIETANLGAGDASNYVYQLEYASSTGVCTGLTNWTAVSTDGSGHWQMATSSYFSNGDSTTAQLSNSEGYTFTAGSMVELPAATSSAITLSENYYTEVEYIISATANADDAGTYCFRATKEGSLLNNYNAYPVLTLAGNTNTAPYFTTYPDDGGSASTSPTNYGSDITFTATADDAENDDYYLAICKTNAITPGNDAPPSCTAGDWCIADLASSTAESSCVYNAQDSGEDLEWYAFACDKHSGFSIGKCSLVSQGSSTPANNSPFAINHAPVFTSVSTAEDNKDPGGTFVITTVSSDSDSFGGDDSLRLYICTTNSASFSGCSGDTLCSVMSTTSPNVGCSFSTSTPATAGTYNYYAFIFDNHGFAASPASRAGTYTVNNTAPTLGTLTLNGGSNITLNIEGAGDKSVSTVNTSVQDLNGCGDIVSAIGTIYMSGVSGGYNCAADYNNCYQITTSNCVISDCASTTDMIATISCTADLKYFAVPTDSYSASNPWKDYNWMSYMQVYDGDNYSATTSSGVEVNTNLAITVVENEIDFGSNMFAGENTGTNNSTSTIINAGNSPLNSNISGTNLDGINYSYSIGVQQIKWSTSTFDYELETDYLKTTSQLVDLDAPRPATTSSNVDDEIYWGIGIPFDAEADTYYGENTFIAIIDDNDW